MFLQYLRLAFGIFFFCLFRQQDNNLRTPLLHLFRIKDLRIHEDVTAKESTELREAAGLGAMSIITVCQGDKLPLLRKKSPACTPPLFRVGSGVWRGVCLSHRGLQPAFLQASARGIENLDRGGPGGHVAAGRKGGGGRIGGARPMRSVCAAPGVLSATGNSDSPRHSFHSPRSAIQLEHDHVAPIVPSRLQRRLHIGGAIKYADAAWTSKWYTACTTQCTKTPITKELMVLPNEQGEFEVDAPSKSATEDSDQSNSPPPKSSKPKKGKRPTPQGSASKKRSKQQDEPS